METEVLIAGVSAILLAISVLYAGHQIKLLRRQHQDNHDWNRRLAAQQTIGEYREIQSMVEAVSEHFDYHDRTEGIPLEDFQKKFKETPGLQSRLHSVINYFEGLARGVRQGIYDEEVVRVSFKGHMMRVHESFKYYIEGRRRKLHNPKIWVELEEVADAWRKEQRAIDPRRKPIGIGS